MYQNLTNEMKDSFKPLLNMFDIQTRTAHKLMREQMDFVSECLDVSTQQADTLSDSDDQTKYFRVPVEVSREIGERYKSVLGKQWNILMEARDALTGEAQSVAKNAESTVKKASEDAEKAVKQASEYAESTVKKASEDADKAVAQATPKAESTSSKSSGSSARKSS